MVNGYIKPDAPTLRINPLDIESSSLPDEQKEALLSFWSEQQLVEEEKHQKRELAYQTDQARVVLSHPDWCEIRADWLDRARLEKERCEWSVEYLAHTYVYDQEGEEYSLLSLPSSDDVPTIHQFYRDLYDVEIDEVDKKKPDFIPDQFSVLVNHRDREHPYQVYDDYETFIEGVQKETSFIYLGKFWEPTRRDGLKFSITKKNAMTHINGVCVDIDRVEDDKGQHFQASWVMNSLFKFFDENEGLTPNYLMLTGTGIQLWYVFGQSVPLFSKSAPRRAKYDAFIKLLYAYFEQRLPKNRFKVDKACAAYNHAFRAPGSPSKNWYPTRLFVRGGVNRSLIDPIALSNQIGAELKPYDVGEWEPKKFVTMTNRPDETPATEKQLEYINKLHDMGCIDDETFGKAGEMTLVEADAAIKSGESAFVNGMHWRETKGGYVETTNGHRVKLRSRDRKLYDYTLARIVTDTKPGSRYMSMFVLAGLAYNCNVSKSALEHDLQNLMNSDWGRKPSPSDGKPISMRDIRSAMKGYNPIGCLRSKEIIEELVGWKYGPSEKRNGRTRQEHLQANYWLETQEDGSIKRIPNKARNNREEALRLRREDVADAKIKGLSEFLSANPTASKRAASKALGMSPPTVQKYWQKACEVAGIDDTRTGNHSPNC